MNSPCLSRHNGGERFDDGAVLRLPPTALSHRTRSLRFGGSSLHAQLLATFQGKASIQGKASFRASEEKKHGVVYLSCFLWGITATAGPHDKPVRVNICPKKVSIAAGKESEIQNNFPNEIQRVKLAIIDKITKQLDVMEAAPLYVLGVGMVMGAPLG